MIDQDKLLDAARERLMRAVADCDEAKLHGSGNSLEPTVEMLLARKNYARAAVAYHDAFTAIIQKEAVA